MDAVKKTIWRWTLSGDRTSDFRRATASGLLGSLLGQSEMITQEHLRWSLERSLKENQKVPENVIYVIYIRLF